MPKEFVNNGDYNDIMTLQEALDHCAADSDIHGPIVENYLEASIIVAEEKLQRSIVTHTIKHTKKRFSQVMHLLMPPVTAVTSVKYYDTDGVQQTIDDTNYIVELQGDTPTIRFKNSYSIPSVSCDYQYPVEIVYTTGPDVDERALNRDGDLKIFLKIILGTIWTKRDALAESASIDDMVRFAAKFVPTRRLFRF